MFDTYLEWLSDQVEYFHGEKHPNLLAALHSIPYIPVMSKDIDRAIDGMNLRNKYYEEFDDNGQIIDGECSVLEFLIGLAQRMNYIYARLDEDRTTDCFWTMLQNIGIDVKQGDVYEPGYISNAIHRVIYREYDANGSGNLFPIQEPRSDQRNVEIWYQMNQYLIEAMRKDGRL